MADEIKNPYVEKIDPNQEFLIGKKACWVVVVLFLLTILVPPIYRNVKAAIDGDWVPVVGFFKPDQKASLEGKLLSWLTGGRGLRTNMSAASAFFCESRLCPRLGSPCCIELVL